MPERCLARSGDSQCGRPAAHTGWHAFVDGQRYSVAWERATFHNEGDPFVLALEALLDARRAGTNRA